jgi:hypothetical protein
MNKKTIASRRRLLSALDRNSLERVVTHEKPWLFSRSNLLAFAAEQWNVELIKEELDDLMKRCEAP